MIIARVKDFFHRQYIPHIIIYDHHNFSRYCNYQNILQSLEYLIFVYNDIELFRAIYEGTIKNDKKRKYAIIIKKEIYVPFDIQKHFERIDMSLKAIFPYLNPEVIEQYPNDIDLLAFVYKECYSDVSSVKGSENFIKTIAFSKDMIYRYITDVLVTSLYKICTNNPSYIDWLQAAKIKSKIEYYGSLIDGEINTHFVIRPFIDFILNRVCL